MAKRTIFNDETQCKHMPNMMYMTSTIVRMYELCIILVWVGGDKAYERWLLISYVSHVARHFENMTVITTKQVEQKKKPSLQHEAVK